MLLSRLVTGRLIFRTLHVKLCRHQLIRCCYCCYYCLLVPFLVSFFKLVKQSLFAWAPKLSDFKNYSECIPLNSAIVAGILDAEESR